MHQTMTQNPDSRGAISVKMTIWYFFRLFWRVVNVVNPSYNACQPLICVVLLFFSKCPVWIFASNHAIIIECFHSNDHFPDIWIDHNAEVWNKFAIGRIVYFHCHCPIGGWSYHIQTNQSKRSKISANFIADWMCDKSCHNGHLYVCNRVWHFWRSHIHIPMDTSAVHGIGDIHEFGGNESAHLHLHGRKFSIENAIDRYDIRNNCYQYIFIFYVQNVSDGARNDWTASMSSDILYLLHPRHNLYCHLFGRNQRKGTEWIKKWKLQKETKKMVLFEFAL